MRTEPPPASGRAPGGGIQDGKMVAGERGEGEPPRRVRGRRCGRRRGRRCEARCRRRRRRRTHRLGQRCPALCGTQLCTAAGSIANRRASGARSDAPGVPAWPTALDANIGLADRAIALRVAEPALTFGKIVAGACARSLGKGKAAEPPRSAAPQATRAARANAGRRGVRPKRSGLRRWAALHVSTGVILPKSAD